MTRLPRLIVLSFISILTVGSAMAFAQDQAPASTAPHAPAYDPDYAPQPTEPDFTLVNLPTTLRLPVLKSEFRLTHRFNGNLRQGSLSDQASGLFGLDSGAAIGLEYRIGVMRHLQAVVYRTNINRQTQFYAKWDPLEQGASRPVSLSGLFSIEASHNFTGDDNAQHVYSPALGAVISRRVGTKAALYATPVWVHNSGPTNAVNSRDTGYIGLGARLHVTDAMYLVAEGSPRIGGYAPGTAEYAFGLEGRVGGHVFQLNFGNNQGTTFLQTATGGFPGGLYMGFNLSRKFY